MYKEGNTDKALVPVSLGLFYTDNVITRLFDNISMHITFESCQGQLAPTKLWTSS